MEPRKIVQHGYDLIAETYLRARGEHGADVALLHEVMSLLPGDARVLDAGCGAGIPVTKLLAERFQVTGVDISASQLRLARSLVPAALFLQGDLTALDFPDDSFDAICSYYAIIHVPREDHPAIIASFYWMLAPGGYLLLSTGASDNPDDREDNWLGAGAPMYWSHYGRGENLRMVADAGFELIWERLVREDEEFGGGTHLFILARKPCRG